MREREDDAPAAASGGRRGCAAFSALTALLAAAGIGLGVWVFAIEGWTRVEWRLRMLAMSEDERLAAVRRADLPWQALELFTRDPHWRVRAEATRGLRGSVDIAELRERLAELGADPYPLTRMEACLAFARAGDEPLQVLVERAKAETLGPLSVLVGCAFERCPRGDVEAQARILEAVLAAPRRQSQAEAREEFRRKVALWLEKEVEAVTDAELEAQVLQTLRRVWRSLDGVMIALLTGLRSERISRRARALAAEAPGSPTYLRLLARLEEGR